MPPLRLDEATEYDGEPAPFRGLLVRGLFLLQALRTALGPIWLDCPPPPVLQISREKAQSSPAHPGGERQTRPPDSGASDPEKVQGP